MMETARDLVSTLVKTGIRGATYIPVFRERPRGAASLFGREPPKHKSARQMSHVEVRIPVMGNKNCEALNSVELTNGEVENGTALSREDRLMRFLQQVALEVVARQRTKVSARAYMDPGNERVLVIVEGKDQTPTSP